MKKYTVSVKYQEGRHFRYDIHSVIACSFDDAASLAVANYNRAFDVVVLCVRLDDEV